MILLTGGVCVVAAGGHAWLLWGACVVAPRGSCVVALGGVHGFLPGGVRVFFRGGWGHAWFFLGGVWFLPGGHAWLLPGGVCMFFSLGGHAWFFLGGMRGFSGGACIGYDEIRSMSGQYASYWNAFLFFSTDTYD